MGKFIDLTGKKFGWLTVIKREYPNAKWGHIKWLCKCDCGNEKIILGDSFKYGKTKSCGCLNKKTGRKNRLKSGISNMRTLFRHYKRSAKKRGYNFELTIEQFAEITKKDCYYCGTKPNQIAKHYSCFGDYIYNGIDRIDNNKGYTIENVVSCCKQCNFAKRDLTTKEFKDWIKNIYEKMIIDREAKK